MNYCLILKKVAAVALTSFSLLGFASSAQAETIIGGDGYGYQPWDQGAANNLIKVAKSHGIKVNDDHPACHETGNTVYGLMQKSTNTMTLCVENIPSTNILGEVIRHELIHAAQFCRINRGLDPLIEPSKQKSFFRYSITVLEWYGQNYPIGQLEMELEARVMGNIYSYSRVAAILDKECGQ